MRHQEKFQMKIQQNVPKFIYVLCVLLAMAFWLVFFSEKMNDFATTLYVYFLPLTATPYIMWVIHKEGQEPEEYLKEMYAGSVWLMWCIRVFMMVVVSVLGVLLLGAIAFIMSLFR